MPAITGSEVQPGQTIKSARRWYTITRFVETDSDRIRIADVTDTKGRPGRLHIFSDDDYQLAPLKPGDPIPPSQTGGMTGFVVGECGHRVAGSEWHAGYRNCEGCGG
jgi:hypothetical protein